MARSEIRGQPFRSPKSRQNSSKRLLTLFLVLTILSIITLTKQTTNPSAGLVPQTGGVGAPEIEITPEMIAAGITAQRGLDPFWDGDDRIVCDVFAAMAQAAGLSVRKPSRRGLSDFAYLSAIDVGPQG